MCKIALMWFNLENSVGTTLLTFDFLALQIFADLAIYSQ